MAGELVRFAGVGLAATGVHASLALGLLLLTAVGEYGANAGGFLGAVGVSWVGHRWFTFARPGHFARLFAVAAAGFAVNNLLLATLLELGWVPGWLALLIAIGLVPFAVFVGLRSWAFRRDD